MDIATSKKYVHYDKVTGKIFGFYNKSETIPLPEPYLEINDILYNLYFDNLGTKTFKIINDNMVEVPHTTNDDISLADYKSLKNAELSYTGRLRQSLPFGYEGNYYDVYNLRRNYFDQRFIEEISTKKTNTIKLQTINDRLVTMTSEQFIEFYIAYGKHIRAIQETLLSLLDKVLDANNKEEIDKVQWDELGVVKYPPGSILSPFTDSSNTFVYFTDAPNDGKVYGRQHNKWMPIDITGNTTPIPPAPTIENPPNNGKVHGRVFDRWVELTMTDIPDANAPNDGKVYGRSYNRWVEINSTLAANDWMVI